MRAERLATPITSRCLERVRGKVGLSLYSPGQVLFYEGHLPGGLHLLADGRVALKRRGRTVAAATPLCALGLECLAADVPYPASAEALQACQVAFVDRTMFQEWRGRRGSPIEGLTATRPPKDSAAAQGG